MYDRMYWNSKAQHVEVHSKFYILNLAEVFCKLLSLCKSEKIDDFLIATFLA